MDGSRGEGGLCKFFLVIFHLTFFFLFAHCQRNYWHEWLLDTGAEVSNMCAKSQQKNFTLGSEARLGREGSRPTARDKGPLAGSPSPPTFQCRTLRSLRSLNVNRAFQVFIKLICRGKKVHHTLFESLLVWFITFNYLNVCWLPFVL